MGIRDAILGKKQTSEKEQEEKYQELYLKILEKCDKEEVEKVGKILKKNEGLIGYLNSRKVPILLFAERPGHPILNTVGRDTEILKMLLAAGADPDLKGNPVSGEEAGMFGDENGITALMYAAIRGRLPFVNALMNSGADLNIQDVNGYNVLMYAIMAPKKNEPLDIKYEIVKKLIDGGIDVNQQNKQGMTALMIASQMNMNSIVKLLIDHRADMNVQSETGSTALIYAAINDGSEAARVLIDHGADLNIQNEIGVTALMAAILFEHTFFSEIIERLIKAGANLDLQDANGYTALMYAASHGQRNTIRLLVEHGADLNIRTKNEGFTALTMAAAIGAKLTVEDLVKAGADTTIRTEDGLTARDAAAKEGHGEIADILA